jgi:hypothetical protein
MTKIRPKGRSLALVLVQATQDIPHEVVEQYHKCKLVEDCVIIILPSDLAKRGKRGLLTAYTTRI